MWARNVGIRGAEGSDGARSRDEGCQARPSCARELRQRQAELIVGQDVDGFCRILQSAGHEVAHKGILEPTPRLEDLCAESCAEVLRLYRALGGQIENPVLRPGAWDVRVDGVLVELDEELHFNRYRLLTLQSVSYERLPWFPVDAYQALCREHETECLANGRSQKRWKNDSTERHFGPSSPRGDLTGNGSSRWKQRALYDFMKDVSALRSEAPALARIAIWESLPEVSGLTVGAIVNRADGVEYAATLWALVTGRLSRSP